jgi:hypothetical protein
MTTKFLSPYELKSDFGTTEEGDEEGCGNWMVGWDRQMKVEQRVACPEIGYPVSEALYANIEEWEKATGKVWYEEFAP